VCFCNSHTMSLYQNFPIGVHLATDYVECMVKP